MPEEAADRRDVALLGATGYTGRKIARRLVEAGLRPILAGRSADRLADLASDLEADDLPRRVADTSDRTSLVELTRETRVLVSAVGPYMEHGPPVLDAAMSGGAHYLDLTGESPWIREVQAWSGRASELGRALCPSFAFESAIADLAAAVALEGVEEPGAVEVTYFFDSFPSSTGTKRSVLKALAERPPENGPRPFRVRKDDWPWAQDAPRARESLWRISYPAAEAPTIGWHAGEATVEVLFALPPAAGVALKLLIRPAMFALRMGAGKLASPFLGGRGAGPDEEAREASRFTAVVEARGRGGARRTVFVEGTDPYGLTADIVELGVRALADETFDGTGVLAPSQVVDPREGLDALGEAGITWTIEES